MDDYDDIVIHPKKGRKESTIPETGVLIVTPAEANLWHEKLRIGGGKSQFIFHSKLTVAKDESFFVAGPGIGAPVASMIMEKIIALGAKRIVLFGWCGAIAKDLSIGDIVLPTFAEVGEGTSQYYSHESKQRVDQELMQHLAVRFRESNEEIFHHGIWSTDAIFRESRKQLTALHDEKHIGAVDMEFSALCSVADFRQVSFAAVLIVSDEIWGKSWRHGFTSERFVNKKNRIMDHLMQIISALR